ncbi:hypothetical protein BZA77DRAFT_65350 [Pyronema omphalodes]|nr:hypothetical protein BZA77DRAFT_65350 [Pyronema omphalodes]
MDESDDSGSSEHMDKSDAFATQDVIKLKARNMKLEKRLKDQDAQYASLLNLLVDMNEKIKQDPELKVALTAPKTRKIRLPPTHSPPRMPSPTPIPAAPGYKPREKSTHRKRHPEEKRRGRSPTIHGGKRHIPEFKGWEVRLKDGCELRIGTDSEPIVPDKPLVLTSMIPKTVEEFLGIPEDMLPCLKDGQLAFKSAAINQRTGLPDRKAAVYKVHKASDFKT